MRQSHLPMAALKVGVDVGVQLEVQVGVEMGLQAVEVEDHAAVGRSCSSCAVPMCAPCPTTKPRTCVHIGLTL